MCDSPSDFTSRKVNNLIIFENIGDTYPIDEDLVVSFTLCPEVKGSCRDWLGIYEQGWRMMETPLAFEWGLGQRRENCESSFFQFRAAKKKDDNNEIIIVNESSGESSQPSSGETYSLREYSGSNEGLHKRLSRLEYMLEVPYVPATEKWDRLIEEHQFETFVSEVFGNNLNANEEYAKNGIAAEHLRWSDDAKVSVLEPSCGRNYSYQGYCVTADFGCLVGYGGMSMLCDMCMDSGPELSLGYESANALWVTGVVDAVECGHTL
ncbi:hypothetical protein AAG570_010803 [Ranatra chinensis]|uniref:SKICH domain-containing protein n=1 Tax=Ranatra chinensis TaxID=642074 RepID=A0ABD0YNM3_9HEMI